MAPDLPDATAIIGANLRRLREDRGWTQDIVADRAGLLQAGYARVELGRSPDVKLSTLLRLAQAFEVRVADLIEGID